ncbi:ATP-binding protein [Ketogulonicigenium vulgare]|uniref:sensor histidine kinase n=1 Tax=Ketogulonicigenium vulgare TaxID=92945 RepID=UPI002358EB32|nr:ATP-binding protein [Ketogulonicigenium vulgare]
MRAKNDNSSPLMRQFLLLAGIVLTLGMTGTGLWVSAQIERIVVTNSGAITALYVDAMIAPVAQKLAQVDDLTPEDQTRLDQIVRQGGLSRAVSTFNLWDRHGRILYSTRPERIGQIRQDNPRLNTALSGRVYASLRNVTPTDGTREQLAEVYSPIHSSRTGQIIAVAEFYTDSADLREDLWQSRLASWIVVALVTLAMFAALCTIVLRGDRTIRQQRARLADQVQVLSHSLAANAALTQQIEQANRRIAEINDLTLQRLSAELHDGPAQHLAFAAMRLDGVAGQEPVALAVNEALRELRYICRGLVLPELGDLDGETIIHRATATHLARTDAPVDVQIAGPLPPLGLHEKNCLYRFVQETLNNGAHHAPGARQSLRAAAAKGGLQVDTLDDGPGFDLNAATDGLGLRGLRERVLGLGGRFTLHSTAKGGTSVSMWLPQMQKGAE